MDYVCEGGLSLPQSVGARSYHPEHIADRDANTEYEIDISRSGLRCQTGLETAEYSIKDVRSSITT